MLHDAYFQNFKTLREYNLSVDDGKLPTYRGILLSDEDILRREVIMDIMCNLGVDFGRIEEKFGIDFASHFEEELEQLKALEEDNLIRIRERAIDILPVGRLLIRNVAMVFDTYLRNKKELKFSRTI